MQTGGNGEPVDPVQQAQQPSVGGGRSLTEIVGERERPGPGGQQPPHRMDTTIEQGR
jgi:hypothetical protein